MDLYSQGQSIIQANQLTEAAREANKSATDFNSTLAAKLDEANDSLDAAASEQQAINMYQGVTSGGKLVGLAAGTKTAKDAASAAKATLKAATSGSEILDPFKYRKLAQAAESSTGAAGILAASPDVLDAAAEEAERFGGDIATTEGATLGLGSGAETSATAIGGDPRFGLDDTVEEAVGRRTGIQTSEGVVGGEAAVETSADAVRTGQFAELAGPGAKAAKGLATTALEDAGKIGAGAVAKSAVAGVGGALDIYKDIQSGWKFDNWKQEVGNIGNLVGSALEIGGALTAWTGLGVGAEALGAVLSVGSTALETAGDIQATGAKRETQEQDIMSEKQVGAAAAQQETVTGRSN